MRIPRSVVVNGKRWKVVKKPLRFAYGLCVYRRREIYIDSESLRDEQEDTFIHELLHACFAEPCATQTEEKVVRRIAPRLLEALKDLRWVK